MSDSLPTGDTTLGFSDPEGPAAPRRLQARAHGLTDRGRVRSSNEDQFLIARLTKSMQILLSSLPQAPQLVGQDEGHIFVVADGVGGARGGKEASASAVLSLEEFLLDTFKWFYCLKGPERESVVAEFQAALRFADRRIQAEAVERPDLKGMGTTLTMAYSLNSDMFVAHAGDSRCYVLREQRLHRITRDHTLMEELLRQGTIQQEQVQHHPLRTLITNALGGNNRGVRADVHKLRIEPGDLFLLSTDGLTEAVSEEEIAAMLRLGKEPRELCELLVARANELGGRDNITVVVWTYEEGPST